MDEIKAEKVEQTNINKVIFTSGFIIPLSANSVILNSSV